MVRAKRGAGFLFRIVFPILGLAALAACLWMVYVKVQNHFETKARQDEIFSSLVLALEDKDVFVRASAADALGKLGDQNAAQALMKLADDDHRVKDVAMNALQKLNVKMDYSTLAEPAPQGSGIMNSAAQGAENVRSYARDSLDYYGEAVQAAAFVIALLVVYSPFFFLLRKLNQWFGLFDGLGSLIHEKILMNRLSEKNSQRLTKTGVHLLVLVGAFVLLTPAARRVMQVRIEPEKPTSFEAKLTKIELAGRMKEASAIPMLEAVLDDYLADADSDPDKQLRWRAAYSLGQIGRTESIATLLDHLDDSNPRVQQYCAWAIGNINGDAAFRLDEAVPLLYQFCTNCNQPITPDNRYCPNCGEKIERAFANQQTSADRTSK